MIGDGLGVEQRSRRRASGIIRRFAVFLSLAILVPIVASASGRYDPRLRFQTISTTRFDIHYHQGEEAQARRLAVLAERVASELDPTLGRPSGRVQVILVDQSDLSNGWATHAPLQHDRNRRRVARRREPRSATPMTGCTWCSRTSTRTSCTSVGAKDGSAGCAACSAACRCSIPICICPKWQIEGLAVHEESALTGQGRVPDTSFRAIVDVASAASRFEPLDRAGGGLVDWPSGNAPYVYGAYFHEFLAARYGEASLRQLTDSTAGRVPYFGSRAFKKIFKRSLGELWREFETASRAEIAPAGAAVSRLTEHGFTVGGPRFGPDGRLYYSVVNPARFSGAARPRIPAPRRHGRSRTVCLARASRSRDPRSCSIRSRSKTRWGCSRTCTRYGATAESPRRLTRGARAADPDVSPDGRVIVCTIQRADRRELATLPVPTGSARAVYPAPLVSEPGVHFASPRWSPDGLSIAVERVSTAGRAEIVLIDPATGHVARTVASSSGSRSMEPAWMADGRLLFSSDRGGDGFRIFVTDIATRATLRLEDTGANASSPEPSRDGRTLVFVGYTADGYDLFSLPLGSTRWTPVDPGSTDAPAPT